MIRVTPRCSRRWGYRNNRAAASSATPVQHGPADQLDEGRVKGDAGLPYLKYDPVLRGLRDDPRYRVLLQRMQLPA